MVLIILHVLCFTSCEATNGCFNFTLHPSEKTLNRVFNCFACDAFYKLWSNKWLLRFRTASLRKGSEWSFSLFYMSCVLQVVRQQMAASIPHCIPPKRLWMEFLIVSRVMCFTGGEWDKWRVQFQGHHSKKGSEKNSKRNTVLDGQVVKEELTRMCDHL